MAALQVRVLLTLTLTLALTTEMAAFQVATTTLENKAGQKVAASEALKGKVVALYVRLALSNRTSCHAMSPRWRHWRHRPELKCFARPPAVFSALVPALSRCAARSNRGAMRTPQPPLGTTPCPATLVAPRRLHPAAGRRVRDGQRRREALRGRLRLQ